VIERLKVQILRDASAATVSEPDGMTVTLNEAELTVKPVRRSSQAQFRRGESPSPFHVIVHSAISPRIPVDQSGFEGKGRSLWYCDAQEEGRFRWYETAFMIHPFISRRMRLLPSDLDPNSDAATAVLPIMGEYQVAWPFAPFDQGAEQPFIDQWILWFAEAVQGHLRRPSTMPEKDPRGSYRPGQLR
jgi:serine/threonine-protein kinase